MKTPFERAFLALVAGFAGFLLLVPIASSASSASAEQRVLAVEFENDVNPVTADYVNQQIDKANDEDYDAVAIILDTPGGLAESMRDIVKKELGSTIPVIVYVSPDGARAASAGVWIGQAADVLAMAPQTNIGSSTPVSVGGEDIQSDLRRKIVNDAAASLRGLAKSHGRNVQWADRAVRKGANLSASEALEQNVIDFVAPTLPALLEKTEGYKTKPKGFVLELAGAQVDTVEMSLWKRILDTLIDPNIIVLLLSVGTLGIIVELWNPGLVLPGTVGAISLVLGLFGLSVLPISWAGILLMLLAAGFFVAEAFVPSHGALTLAGGISFVLGSLLLFDPAGPAYDVSLPVALAIAGILGAFMLFVVTKLVQARRRPAVVGMSSIVGERGIVRRDGYVLVNGELWRAHGQDDEMLPAGQEVEVSAVEDGLTLAVRPVEKTTA